MQQPRINISGYASPIGSTNPVILHGRAIWSKYLPIAVLLMCISFSNTFTINLYQCYAWLLIIIYFFISLIHVFYC
jgi:hypothetical protein